MHISLFYLMFQQLNNKPITEYFVVHGVRHLMPTITLLHNDTYRGHAVDLIPSQLQQLLVSALSHQLECGLLEARLALEQQACYMSDALEREREKGGEMKE